VTGVLTTTAATVSNGGGQFNGTVTVGVDDTGYDVKFFGATAGAYMLWDESADDLILGGAAGLSVNSAALVTGVLTANGGAVFNESGADVDFRVESDTKANALFVEGSSGNVGIGSTSSATSRAVITDDGAVNDRLLFLDSSGGLGGGQAGPFYGLYSDITGNNNSTAVYGAYLNATPAVGTVTASLQNRLKTRALEIPLPSMGTPLSPLPQSTTDQTVPLAQAPLQGFMLPPQQLVRACRLKLRHFTP
jgi:hypothetical protein